MGSGNRGGFVLDKGGESSADCDFGLGLKMMMMGNQHHHHHSHSHNNDESGTKFAGFSGDQGTSSPGGCSSGLTGVSGGGIGSFGAMFSSNNQDSSVASSVQRSSLAFDPSSFKSWGGVSTGGGEMTRVFTPLQWQELQRQTIIYKYMVASMPVPPELLISMNSKYPSQLSLPSYQSNVDHGSSLVKSGLDLRYAIGSKDAEPWRCKRTDGKKWRCSRDVAPDQKYCERHSHKGRPSRSRKHVEPSSTASSSPSSTSSSISIARNSNNNNNTLIPSPTSSAVNPANISIKPSFLYQPSSHSMFLSQHHQNSRLPEWFMKREAHHDHHQSTSIPAASSFFPQTELDQITPTRASHSSYMGSSQSHHSPTLPRQFLDAWSIGQKPQDIVEITGKPTDPSLLTLSMAGGSGVGGVHRGEEAVAQLGMGLFDPERGRDVGGGEGGERYSSWMGSSGPGGPLAEALCLGIVDPDDGGSRGSHDHGESSGGGGGGNGMGFNK